MSRQLKNKTVFITGASAGIGKACAELFAESGARILVCARRVDKLNALVQHLQSTYQVDAYGFVLDMADAKQIQKTVAALPSDWQNIDILINNAGAAFGLSTFQDSDPQDWEQMISLNLKGVLYVTHAILQNMIARNCGHVINIGSIAGIEAYPKGGVYCATKFAIDAFSKSLNMDLLGTKLRVTTVHPGKVHTEFSIVRFKGDQARADQEYQGYTPLYAQDIADVVCYCASRPEHVTIREITVLPNDQASAVFLHKT